MCQLIRMRANLSSPETCMLFMHVTAACRSCARPAHGLSSILRRDWGKQWSAGFPSRFSRYGKPLGQLDCPSRAFARSIFAQSSTLLYITPLAAANRFTLRIALLVIGCWMCDHRIHGMCTMSIDGCVWPQRPVCRC